MARAEFTSPVGAAAAAARARASSRARCRRFSHLLHDDGFELARVVVHVFEARAFRPFDVDEHAADVGDRRELARASSGTSAHRATTSTPTAPTTSHGRRIRRAQAPIVDGRRARWKNRSTARAKRLRCVASAGSFEASIGVSVSATSAENSTDAASVKPNSRNRRPRSPGRNEIGTNTAASVSVVAMTAKPISRLPRHRGDQRRLAHARCGDARSPARRWHRRRPGRSRARARAASAR